MRTINFRGKSIDTNEWLYGDLVRSYDMKRCAILVNDKSSYEECEVNPCTVGQFTGLYDKNGKEIYEGDILKFSDGNKLYIVKFIKGMFQASDLEGEGYSLYLLSNLDNHNYEIVGNVFDNPELLEEDK